MINLFNLKHRFAGNWLGLVDKNMTMQCQYYMNLKALYAYMLLIIKSFEWQESTDKNI